MIKFETFKENKQILFCRYAEIRYNCIYQSRFKLLAWYFSRDLKNVYFVINNVKYFLNERCYVISP